MNDNKSIIASLQAGNEDAFDAIYRFYYARLCGFCSNYLHEQKDIEDIVQETMLWLWENRNSLVPELTLKSLLFTMVKNKSLNRTVHLEMRERIHQEIAEKYEEAFTDPDFYTRKDLFAAYRKAVSQLPEALRVAFELSREKQVKHKDIAKMLQVSDQTVNRRISLALQQLRIALKDFLPLFLLYFGPDFMKRFY